MSDLITILLATYNGEKYLSHQLNSLLNQTYPNWHLLIRDDNSTDKTPKIIEKFSKSYPGRVTVLENNHGNTGSISNFSTLFTASRDSKYIMYCDQDDEWVNDKIEVTLLKMHELEKQYGINFPLLVFTDFTYVDDEMKVIESKRKFTVNKIKTLSFPQLLVQNPAYGCTCMLNKALADKMALIPLEAENHDYWTALVASALGKLYYLPKKTIFYRQHNSNVSGNYNDSTFKKRLQRVIFQKQNVSMLIKKRRMMLKFQEMYYFQLDTYNKQKFDDYLALYNQKSLRLLWRNFRNGIRSQTTLQTLLFYISIFFYSNSSKAG